MSDVLQKLYNACINTPFFGIVLSIVTYKIGLVVREKTKLVIMNPLLIATIIILVLLKGLGIPYSAYKQGADILMDFLAPVTAVLAIAMYNQRKVLFENLIPVVAGTVAGAVTSIATVYVLCRFFHIDESIMRSMMPKSVTTPIALSLSGSYGGIPAITMLSVIVTGISGAVLCPTLVKTFHIKYPEAAGIAMGTCSHAVGTSAAMELGEVYGAMSSVAIGCMGLATTFVFMLIR